MNNPKKPSKNDPGSERTNARSSSLPDELLGAGENSSGPVRPRQPAHGREEETLENLLAPDGGAWPNQYGGGPAGGGPVIPPSFHILQSIWRFKWTVLAVAAIIAGLAIPSIWGRFVPMYRARAEVRVRPIIPYLVFQTEESGKIPLYDSFVNTQIPIISSTPVLQRVLDEQDVRQTQWYKQPPKTLLQQIRGTSSPPLDRLAESLSASPRKETEIIDVSFTAANPQDATLILNKILDHYVRYLGEMTDATEDKVYRRLAEQYQTLGNDIRGRESGIDDLRSKLGTSSPQELVSQRKVRLDEAQGRLAQVQQNIDLLQWELDELSSYDSNELRTDGQSGQKTEYYEDEQWRELDSAIRQLRHDIEVDTRKETHPDAIQAKKQLDFLEERLQQRQEQLDELLAHRRSLPVATAGTGQLDSRQTIAYLEHQLKRARREEKLLLADIENQQTEFDTLFQNAQLLEKQNTDLAHKRELYDAVRQRLDQKDMERNAPGSIEILTRAVPESGPYNDRRLMFTAMVSILAVGAGGGLAFIRAGRSRAVYGPEDMPYPMQIPFLGRIPRISSRRAKNGQVGSTMIESIRVVRTALLSRLNGQGSAAVLITSAVAGTGKSQFSLMLGESLARSGKKVLLVDADLRKMTLTRRFGLCDKSGFMQSLARGTISKHYVFKVTETAGLGFMPAGKQQGENGTVFEEIAKGNFAGYVDKLRQRYDIILFDSPPVLAVADSTILSNQVDGTIMVEREHISQQNDQIDALVRLSSGGGNLIGTVFVGSSRQNRYAYV